MLKINSSKLEKEKRKLMNFRIKESTIEKLTKIAKDNNVSRTSLICFLIDEKYDELKRGN